MREHHAPLLMPLLTKQPPPHFFADSGSLALWTGGQCNAPMAGVEAEGGGRVGVWGSNRGHGAAPLPKGVAQASPANVEARRGAVLCQPGQAGAGSGGSGAGSGRRERSGHNRTAGTPPPALRLLVCLRPG